MNLSIQNLSKSYANGVKALDNISLEIGTGMFALLGPNGAGKSSLMRTLATLQYPDAGTIEFNSRNIFQDTMNFRQILGYLPQEFGVYPNISAWALLDYFARLKGISSKSERQEMIHYVLDITNLLADKDKAVDGFSGGMKQRFGIAQLLMNTPKLIIVDEATAGLDPAERQRFLNILREISSKNIIIFSTHLVDDVADLCNDMAILNHGKIQANCTPQDAARRLEGNIWEQQIKPDELEQMQQRYTLLSSAYTANQRISIRVFSETKPSSTFMQSKPTLDDFYFHVLHSSNAI